MAKYTPQFMPNAKPVEPIRVLDENGKLLSGQSAPMTDEQAAYAIRVMMMGRGFDEKSFSLQRQGRLGTFAPVIGQEASTLGPAMAPKGSMRASWSIRRSGGKRSLSSVRMVESWA